MKERPLNPSEGKCLRYTVSRDKTGDAVYPSDVVVSIEWSDLPKSLLAARGIFARLSAWGFVERVGRQQFKPTEKGRKRIRQADQQGEWNE